MKTCIHAYVSGKVQGVWFRSETKKQAELLRLTGWTKNLSDGRVEVVACGDSDKVAVLQLWLRQGPPLAEVTDVTIETLPWKNYPDFQIIS